MKFKNIYTGVVLIPVEKQAIELLKQNEDFEIVTEKKDKPSKEDKEETK